MGSQFTGKNVLSRQTREASRRIGTDSERVSTGIEGLDEILRGGLVPQRAYLVRGGPGTGKSTLGMHFVAAAERRGEAALFITLEEAEENVRKDAASLGIDLKGVAFLDLSTGSEFFAQVQAYDIFSPAEVEREPTTQKIIQQIEAIKPKRVFLEVMTQFRYLSTDPFQFRKQVLSLLRFLQEKGATVLMSSEGSPSNPDDDLQFMADGIIELEFDGHRRCVWIRKFRGSDFRSGRHSLRLSRRGMEVFPRLVPAEHGRPFALELIPSGVPELDELLHGGLERGTITIITGPTGVGKTSLGLQFMKEAAGRGEHSVVFTFEEWKEMLVRRSEAIHIPVRAMLERDILSIEQVEPLRYSADEFSHLVREEVEQRGARIVMLDSTAGYHLSMGAEDLVSRLHALCKYLTNMGVTGILISEQEHITGEFQATETGISYLADNILFLRYLERGGEMRRVLGVLKKRVSDFERTLRELELTRYGIKVGKPLAHLRGILTGNPEWVEHPK